MSNTMQKLLQDYYAQVFPTKSGLQVKEFANITDGWESEIYSFVAEYGPATGRLRETLVLRLYSGENAHTKAAHEFHTISQLHRAGYPVPQVFLVEHEHSPFRRPFVIMEKIDGQVMWPLLSSSSPEKRRYLLTLFCTLFVQLHALDWRLFVGDADRCSDPYFSVDRWLDGARRTLNTSPQIGFLPIVEWLQDRRDDLLCPRPSPVHQDYHPNNVLMRDDGSAVVIDWTGFDVSDARFDLGWTLVLAHAYAGEYMCSNILQEYERLSEAVVKHIECFEVCACARRLFDIAVSLSAGAERRGMRREAITMIKQQREAHQRVYDLLLERTEIRITAIERLFASLSW
ncbi:phosphotransferase [Candidatus Acetothermia bacterium]|nr:phosphotransferase [Candidatus Acetothermia bacterium]MCI2431458.1 phosphotransferase [Candidatus Acetothermia bacterium]MCI2437122.1 phosphotransferase [Candidatus Acetothermia bacterium]